MRNITECYLIDVDGTLANCEHRTHHVRNGASNWNAFFAEMCNDTPIQWVIDIVNKLYQHNPIIIVTARPGDFKAETVKWLQKHGVQYDAIYTRAAGDFRSDDVVKLELLDQILADGYIPLAVLDDRAKVVNMWRLNGVPCAQVEGSRVGTRICSRS